MPPKSRAGRRNIAIPSVFIAALTERLAAYDDGRDDAFAFLGKRGAFLRGGNFWREAKWAEALKEMGLQGFAAMNYGTRATHLAAQFGAIIADLRVRMEHDSRGFQDTAHGPVPNRFASTAAAICWMTRADARRVDVIL
ncbi:hypothetical protein ACFXJ8_39120 [Nonomuraea sp. NPDC059194]|uniref:hypothetical protein n=1 Tax=Nonomuraea sp. NPDC059194 TaxID=3346764 RepID=UPI0036A60B11